MPQSQSASPFVVALAVYLFVVRASGHEYTLIFENAGQLVVGDNVQIGGRAVGTVDDIRLTDNNQAAVRILVEEPYAPLREGTDAVIRLTSLSGIANRYVAISPGPDASQTLADGTTIGTVNTTTAVDLDQLFNTLTPDARRDLQGIIAGSRTQLDGKGEEAAAGDGVLQPAALQRPPAGQRGHARRGRAGRTSSSPPRGRSRRSRRSATT